jgi:hypothetical protein
MNRFKIPTNKSQHISVYSATPSQHTAALADKTINASSTTCLLTTTYSLDLRNHGRSVAMNYKRTVPFNKQSANTRRLPDPRLPYPLAMLCTSSSKKEQTDCLSKSKLCRAFFQDSQTPSKEKGKRHRTKGITSFK